MQKEIDQKAKSFTTGHIIIWLGIVCGNVEVFFSIICVFANTFASVPFRKAWVTFIIMQPLWYLFISVLYIAQSPEVKT
jgi:vacuolar-type H+-ATPase subunit I/STV1